MATQPPIKTKFTDIDAVVAYLKTQVGWVSIETVKKSIPATHADVRKIEAMRYIGLLERDGNNVKLTEGGRKYASASGDERAEVLREQIRTVLLYYQTLTWAHFNRKEYLNKADVANYWLDNQADELAGAAGAALSDAAVFFMRVAGAAGLGKFTPAGSGRETNLKPNAEALAAFVTGDPPPVQEPAVEQQQQAPPPPPPAGGMVATGLNVNVEIHIAADAKPATVEEIFKNMRKYLIDQQPEATDGS